MRAYLGLGSNLGDREAYLRQAVAGMADLVAVSAVYESAPSGGPPEDAHRNYLNAVAALETSASPRDLLELAARLEQQAERVRTVRWGPRTLDVDILLIDDLTVDEPDLQVPHPRMQERAFVLAPLADLDPSLVPPERVRWARDQLRRTDLSL